MSQVPLFTVWCCVTTHSLLCSVCVVAHLMCGRTVAVFLHTFCAPHSYVEKRRTCPSTRQTHTRFNERTSHQVAGVVYVFDVGRCFFNAFITTSKAVSIFERGMQRPFVCASESHRCDGAFVLRRVLTANWYRFTIHRYSS